MSFPKTHYAVMIALLAILSSTEAFANEPLWASDFDAAAAALPTTVILAPAPVPAPEEEPASQARAQTPAPETRAQTPTPARAHPEGASADPEGNLDAALRDAIIELSKSGDKDGEADPGLKALLRHRENMEALRAGKLGDDEPPAVAMVATVGFFAAIVLIVAFPVIARKRRREIDAAVQKAAIEKGMQYVPEIPAPKRAAPNDKRTGLLVAGLGLAALLPLLLAGYSKWSLVGLAPIVLGAVYFVVGLLLPPSKED